MTGPARALCYRLAARPACVTRRSPASGPSRSTGRPPASPWPPPTPRTAIRRRCPSRATWRTIWPPYVATLAPETPVFPLPEEKGAEMLQADLAAAGIPYRDASGLFFDFHALRCQMATLADAAGVSSAGRAEDDAAFDPGTDRPLYPAPGRGYRGRRIACSQASSRPGTGPRRWPRPGRTGRLATDNRPIRPARPPGCRRFRAGRLMHKQSLWPPFGHRRGRFRSGCVVFWHDDAIGCSDVDQRKTPCFQGV